MLACSHRSARIPARPLVETRSHVALEPGAADRHVGTVSGSFPVLPFVSALLRGSCGARRLRSLCFAFGPVPVLAPPCRAPQKSSFWSGEPRPLASGCPRQTGRTGETYVPQQNHSHRFPRRRCRKEGQQRDEHRSVFARNQNVVEGRRWDVGIPDRMASMRRYMELTGFSTGSFSLKPVVAGRLTCRPRSSSCPNLMPWETTAQA